MPSEASAVWMGAEALASLLSGEAAFRCALTVVEHDRGMLGGATLDVANELESWLRPRARGASLDSLRRHREHVWFGSTFASRRTMAEILAQSACEALDHRGSKVMLKNAAADQAALWRSLSLAIPADLLSAALCATCGCDPPADSVDVSGPQIRKLLEREPACETHMHVGAAFSFPVLWSSLMHVIGTTGCSLDSLVSRAVPFGTPRELVARLLQAAIARLVMAGFLWRRTLLDETLDFDAFLAGSSDTPVTLEFICRQLPWAPGPKDAWRSIYEACRALAMPLHGDVASLRRLYHILQQRPTAVTSGDPIDTVIAADPLCCFFGDRRCGESPETIFTTRGLRYLLATNDEAFARLFWQYQRVRCRTFRYLTQEPGTAGLDWFTEHYTRISPMRQALENALYRAALDLQSTGLRLGALEARTSPGDTRHDVTDEIRKLARQALARKGNPIEVGLVLHFIKRGEWNQGHSGDPSASGWRYGGWFGDARRKAMAIEGALENRPELLMLLRGIDVANHELAIPTWVVLPILTRVRVASTGVAARMRTRAPFWNCEPLAVTYHAGEDFRRLVEGLRRVHEPIEFGLLQPGDRIGHGVALGTDAESRRRLERHVVQPREERLFDLLWELQRYATGEFVPDGSRIEVVRDEVRQRGREIFACDVGVEQLLQLRRDLHSSRLLESGFGTSSATYCAGQRDWNLMRQYLADPAVFVRAIAPIAVEHAESETAMLVQAQKFLRRRLGSLEITIESNPSSNLLIGDFFSLEEHPAFRIQPIVGHPADDGSVLLSVNTDNPVTFATRLADEYAYLYYALIRNGVTADNALAWVNARREDGWRSRFTLRESADETVLRIIGHRDTFDAARDLAHLKRTNASR